MKTSPDGAPATAQGIIADLQRQLADRTAERDEAVAQQTATAEVLQVINSSPGDLAPVFEAILDKAHALCDATRGALFLDDGGKFKAAVVHGYPEDVANYLRAGVDASHPHYKPLFAGERVHFPDLTQVANAQTGRLVSGRGGVRTNLLIPLLKDNALLGWISCNRTEVRPFSGKEIALIENFAAQAVLAIDNARLITETRAALEQQTATAEVLQVINSAPGDLAPVFDAMLEKAMQLCDVEFGSLQLYDGEMFRAAANRGLPQHFADRLSQGYRPGPAHPFSALFHGDAFVQVPDLAQSDTPQGAFEFGGMRTVLSVPLRRQGSMIGIINLARNRVEPFTDKQIALLQNFAAQAVIAMENARLITETREALEQQTATTEVLQVINSSPGDLAPVFDAMLEKAFSLCEAAQGTLRIYDGEKFNLVAVKGEEALVEAVQRLGPITPAPHNPYTPLVKGDMLVHIADSRETPGYREIATTRERIDRGGIRTWLAVPLRKGDVLLGAFAVYRREVRAFSDKQIALLQNFAAQAVIAIENARLITETREALEQQTATAEVLQVINSSPGDLAPVFDAMLEKAARLLNADFGILWRFEDGLMRLGASHNVADAFIEHHREPMRPGPESGPGRMMRGGNGFITENFLEFPPYLAGDPAVRSVVELAGARSAVIAPLRKDGAALGSITVYRKEVRPFSEKQLAVLENFAAQAVIAIENARLLGELRQRTEEVAELNRGLEARVAEQLDELGRVGRLKRFLAPQLAELIVSRGDENILESHRREIVVVFCDLRGYTAFTETAEPEEVLDFLREYHGALGPLVSQFEGTLDQFSGDGIMVFFNDPVPIPDAAERALRMAVAMREAAATLIADWRERGRDLGFGAGIAQGYATLGQIGFSERSGYTAIGTVCNVAARLCAEAKDGQILLSQRVNAALKGSVATEPVGALALKGLTQPVITYNVPLAVTQPALRVIEGGPQTL